MKEKKRVNLENPEEMFAIELPKALDISKELFNKFLPNHKVNFEKDKIDCEGISLCPIVMEVQTISAIKEVLGWSVYGIKTTTSSHYEEPDTDDVIEFGEFVNLNEAISEFAVVVLRQHIELYFEAKGYEEWVKEEAELPEKIK